MISVPKRLVCAMSILTLLMVTTAMVPAMAQTTLSPAPAAMPPDAIVAIVGDEGITEADLGFAAEDLAQELSQMPIEARRPFLVRVLIDMKVMAQAGRAAGMADTPLFRQRQAYLEDRALRRAYFSDAIAGAVTEEAVRAEYDKFVAEYEPQDEIHASHILVSDEQEAKFIKNQIDEGVDFAELAQEKSIDPGATNGGDLGFFGRGMMVAPFEAAAFALTEDGQVSEPVQSQFGWHIIKRLEQRNSSPPAFELIASQLQQRLLMQTFNDTVARLTANTVIDIPDTDLKAAVEAQSTDE